MSDVPKPTQMPNENGVGGVPPAPPEPRALTQKGRRRSWGEPAVRGCWLAAVVLVGVVAWLVVEQLVIARETNQRISQWRSEKATVDKLEAGARGEYTSRVSYYVIPEELPSKEAVLSFPEAGGRRTVNGYLKAQLKSVHPGEVIDILVDPANASRWTDRIHPQPLGEQLLVPLLPSPLPVILLAAALWQRSRLLRLWQMGVRRRATVVNTHQSALSPRSDVVRCTVNDHRDKRVIRVTLPHAAARLNAGDAIDLITPAKELTPALAAMLYEEYAVGGRQ